MKRLILAAILALPALSLASDTYVQPYIKKDGTFVPGHYQTKANETKVDNYSSKPNVNPYTGKPGKVDPYKVEPNKDTTTESLYGTKPKKLKY